MRKRAGRIAALVGAAAVGAMTFAAPAWALTDTIRATDNFTYEGGTGGLGAFQVDAGDTPTLENEDLTPSGEHDAVARDEGPDGEPLFGTELVEPGGNAEVDGTQYVGQGTYDFYCTIHVGMEGVLKVNPGPPLARPDIDVKIKSSKIKKVRKGKLKVTVKAFTKSDDISLEAKRGPKVLATTSGLDLSAGESEPVTMKLTNKGKKDLKKKDQAKISLTGEVPFGSPDKATKKLK